jgi:hypothetical protein
MMELLYLAETEVPGSCATKRIGLPKVSLEKARVAARDASILHGRAYVYRLETGRTPLRRLGFDGWICCGAFEGGNELPWSQW